MKRIQYNRNKWEQVSLELSSSSSSSHKAFYCFDLVQINSNDYRHVRTVPHQQPTTTSPSTSPTPTNLQLRTQSYQRNQAQVCLRCLESISANKCISFKAAALATLEVRAQLPTSPKPQQSQQSQQQPPQRPPSTTPRTPSINQSAAEYVIQSQAKSLTTSTVYSSHRSLFFLFILPFFSRLNLLCL